MAMIKKTVETPDAKSWIKILVGTILGTPLVAGLFILATSPEIVLTPIGLISCSTVTFGGLVLIYHRWRPKILG